MSIRDLRRRAPGGGRPRTYSASADAARRAMRARDHLERKRDRERKRRARERTHAERQSRRSPSRSIASVLVFASAIGAGIVVGQLSLGRMILPGPDMLERVEVLGASILSPESIVHAAGLDSPKPLEAIDPRRIATALESEPWIESARALRLPTGKLVISVVEREAIARWKLDAKGKTVLVDPRGERFEGDLGAGGPLPLVSGHGTRAGTSLPSGALEILGALEQFGSLTEDPGSLTLLLPGDEVPTDSAANGDQTGYVLQLGEKGPRALLGRRLFPERVARLAALIENGEPAFLSARVIDLRYADRAVLRAEPASG